MANFLMAGPLPDYLQEDTFSHHARITSAGPEQQLQFLVTCHLLFPLLVGNQVAQKQANAERTAQDACHRHEWGDALLYDRTQHE